MCLDYVYTDCACYVFMFVDVFAFSDKFLLNDLDVAKPKPAESPPPTLLPLLPPGLFK